MTRLVRSLFAVITLSAVSMAPPVVQKAEAISCGACVAIGCRIACGTISPAVSAGFTAIDSALTLSEMAIMESIGYGASGATGMIGFPALASEISAAEAKQTSGVVSAIEATATTLSAELRKLPVNQQLYEMAVRQGPASASYKKEVCSSLDLGSTFRQGNLAAAQRVTERVENWARDGGALGSPSNQVQVYPPLYGSDGSIDPEGARARMVLGESRIAAAKHQVLRPIREAAEAQGGTITDLLTADLLIADAHRTIEPNLEDPMSPDQLSQVLLQMMTVSQPDSAAAMRATASDESDLKAASAQDVEDMRASIPLAIVNRHLKLRTAHEGKLGAEDYMRQMMGEGVAFQAESDEGFMYLMANHRTRSPEWLTRVAADSKYALYQIAQSEAEQLYIKYQRWLTKRETNMALAQLLATVQKSEKP